MGSGVGEPLREKLSIKRKGTTNVHDGEALKECLPTRSKGKVVIENGECIANRFAL